jgi:hypothetical protein
MGEKRCQTRRRRRRWTGIVDPPFEKDENSITTKVIELLFVVPRLGFR